jgi:ribosomal protein L12E/L44/L45/RPP1/RPP2
MKENSRDKFNPVTKEIKVEGSESFVKTYFKKLWEKVFGPTKGKVKKAPKAPKAAPAKKAEKAPKVAKTRPPKKAKKAPKKEPGEKMVTNIDMIIGLIQGSAGGISTAELKEKTGLANNQIWSIVNRAAKEGKIRKVKRGVYGGVAGIEDSPKAKTE